jgi:L-ascorbate metabolism protein UlaG (beta-lactamase superfamily)
VTLTFQWLGTASLVIKADGQVLAIDPFFTRPSLPGLLRPLAPDRELVVQYLPRCDFVLVTHAHYDHLLDVSEVMRQTDAVVYGSANACHLLAAVGAPATKTTEITVGDRLVLGSFQVEVIRGQHSPIPLAKLFNGPFHPGLTPPLHTWDYRMDICLGYRIIVNGIQLLICAGDPHAADLWFVVAQEPELYYRHMLQGIHPRVIILIHWDNFTRPLSKPIRRFTRPGRLSLQNLEVLAHQILPGCRVIIPEVSKEYAIAEIL